MSLNPISFAWVVPSILRRLENTLRLDREKSYSVKLGITRAYALVLSNVYKNRLNQFVS